MKYAFIGADIISGVLDEKGEMPVRAGYVLVEKGVFSEVHTSGEAPDTAALKAAGYEIVDLGGKYLLPGLINLHVHLPLSGAPIKAPKSGKMVNFKTLYKYLAAFRPTERLFAYLAQKNARTAFLSGTTTIRSVGGVLAHDAEARDKIAAGEKTGPRILCANAAVTVPGGHFAGSLALEANTPDEARSLVRQIAGTKPDLIKLMVTGGVMDAGEDGVPGRLMMPPEMIRAACEQAHELGYKVAAHVESTEGIKAALRNGVDFIEHGADPDEECLSLFLEKKAALVCTMLPFMVCAEIDPALGYCPPLNVKNGTFVLKNIIRCAAKCLKRGIPVGLGTDAGCPFSPQYDTWREVDLFARRLGVTPAFALHTATLKNAELIGIDRITGSIEAGKSADFMVVRENPLADLAALQSPEIVSVFGRPVFDPKIRKSRVAQREFDKLRRKK